MGSIALIHKSAFCDCRGPRAKVRGYPLRTQISEERSVRRLYDGKEQWQKEMTHIRCSPNRFSRHCRKRIKARDISVVDVAEVLRSGKIIQGHAPGTYGNNQDPVRVIIGYVEGGRILHLVVAIRGNVVMIVTAYEPDPEIWEDDCRTLKPR